MGLCKERERFNGSRRCVASTRKVYAPGDTRRRHWIQLPSFPFNLIACKCQEGSTRITGTTWGPASIENRRAGMF